MRTTTAALRGRAPRRWLLLALVLLIMPALLGEGAVRTLIATGRLAPAAAHFRTLEVSWVDLERAGTVDVLLIGPSTVHSGIDPAVLGELASEALGRPVSVFNLGIPGLGGEVSILQQLEREGRLPELVIVGVSALGLGAGAGRDGTGDSPYRRSPMGELFTRCEDSPAAGYEAVADCQAGLVSALWRWRGRLDQIVDAVRSPLSGGYRGDRFRRPDGFSAGPPRTVATIESQIEKGLQTQDRLIEMRADSIDRYARIARFLDEHGVAVTGTSIPYAPVYMDAAEAKLPGFGASWQDAIGTLAEGTGIPFVDPVRFGDWWGDGSSQDIKHLSREGAVEFTRQLWDIPAFRAGVTEALE